MQMLFVWDLSQETIDDLRAALVARPKYRADTNVPKVVTLGDQALPGCNVHRTQGRQAKGYCLPYHKREGLPARHVHQPKARILTR